ncbi:MAG TPA: hypothetical protein VJJ46_11430 [Anaerolineales bacterium]|nr:hypothetical protein [Anaerolineales bacterium]
MPAQEKITIIEGPPPTFEAATEPWLLGLVEGPSPSRVVLCRLRTFNGPALVERCFRAWRNCQSAALEFRSDDGLTQQAQIVAARWADMEDGQILLLWVSLDENEIEIQIEIEDELDDDADDLDPDPGS